jgi:hypothetical protein
MMEKDNENKRSPFYPTLIRGDKGGILRVKKEK